MMFGRLSLRYKVLTGLLADAFPSILGGHFSFLNYPENWPNSQWLPHPGDLSTNGGEGWRREWVERACLTSWNLWSRLPLWARAELFKFSCGPSESADSRTALASVPAASRMTLCEHRQAPFWRTWKLLIERPLLRSLLLVHLAKLD